jgi:hypothetical protein
MLTQKKENCMQLEEGKVPDTNCFTYSVTMTVQVIAPSREVADQKLNEEGGYVSAREVEFVKSTLIYTNESE